MMRILVWGMAAAMLAVSCSGAGESGTVQDETSTTIVGKKAPDFTLPAASGDDVSLSDYRGERPVLLYFSMGPGLGGCISQVVDLQKDSEFKNSDVELLSIATDPVSAWQEEAQSSGITLPLLSDDGAKVSNEYGVMRWNMMGEPGHTFVLVDRDGVVVWVRDYGAPEHGGLMYVDPKDLMPQIDAKLS